MAEIRGWVSIPHVSVGTTTIKRCKICFTVRCKNYRVFITHLSDMRDVDTAHTQQSTDLLTVQGCHQGRCSYSKQLQFAATACGWAIQRACWQGARRSLPCATNTVNGNYGVPMCNRVVSNDRKLLFVHLINLEKLKNAPALFHFDSSRNYNVVDFYSLRVIYSNASSLQWFITIRQLSWHQYENHGILLIHNLKKNPPFLRNACLQACIIWDYTCYYISISK